MNENTAEFRDTFNRTKSMVREIIANDEKQLIWAVGIKLVLFAFVLFYLGWIYTNFLRIDADLVVLAGSEKAKETLPIVKDRLVKHLNKIAPEIVDQSSEEVLNNLPVMGQEMESLLRKTISGQMDILEKDFSMWLASYIHTSKKQTDEMFPNISSSYEKMTLLRKYLIDDLHVGFDQMNTQVSDTLKDHQFTSKLNRLAFGHNLTEKEKLQRELLAIWYVLINRQVDKLEPDTLIYQKID